MRHRLIDCVERVHARNRRTVHASYARVGTRVSTTACGLHIVDPVTLDPSTPLRCQKCWRALLSVAPKAMLAFAGRVANRSSTGRVVVKSELPEYNIWCQMKARCFNKRHTNYRLYGGRGITVCRRWLDFDHFYEDMGPRPVGHSLDRINNNGNYEPTNCRWATVHEQANNRRNSMHVEFNGKLMTVPEACVSIGISYREFMSVHAVLRKNPIR